MIITQTPIRISFLGGGTDYPAYFRQHSGAVLNATINHFTLITVHPLTRFSDHRIRVHYSKVEAVNSIDELQHPSARECLRYLEIDGGVEIHYVSDLPARTGLGSSSSATVGLLMALHAYKGEMVTREQVAVEAVHVEQTMIAERVGSQDQYACALGGLNHFEFRTDGSVCCEPIVLSTERRQELQDHVLMFYTGIQRHAHELLEEQIERTESGDNLESLDKMKNLVREGVSVLCSEEPLSEFGRLLDESWTLKRGLSTKISRSEIDLAYAHAIDAGASGGKLLGAGGGGFLLVVVDPQHQAQVRQALAELPEVPVRFDNLGSRVVYYRP